jgi:hypothetical protein
MSLKLSDFVNGAGIHPADVPTTVMQKLQAVIDKQAPRPAAAALKPVDMILHCPACLHQHIDARDPPYSAELDDVEAWTNPIHRSHLCGFCGFVWRPADVPTNGVETIKTRGKNDMVLIDGPAVELERLRLQRDLMNPPKLEWSDTEPKPKP